MTLLPHQLPYSSGYSDKAFAVHEGGTGKTVCASVWLADGRDSDALVLCTKRIIKKWEAELKKWGTKATVLSKEQFKKYPQKKWSAIVVDEADEYASPLFTKARSALSTTLYKLLQTYPDTPVFLATATPIRSTPWNLHSLLCYLGQYEDYKTWRERFFELKFPRDLPYLVRPSWVPKSSWRTDMRTELEKHADIVLLKDCVDELPAIEERVVTLKTTPLADVTDFIQQHRHEQKGKAKEIITVGKEYRKVLVVAYYIEQITELQKTLSRDRQTFVVHGGTKNQEAVLADAIASDECYLIVQASLGVGFDGDAFSCVVFASLSNSVRDHVQMKYRVRRIHNLHPVLYVYLLAGRCDKRVYTNIQAGRDFVPSEWDYDTAT